MTEAIIHDDQIEAINRARDALDTIVKTNHHDFDTQASGMIVALADTASNALFQVLNWYNAHAYAELTEAQLHNSRPSPSAGSAEVQAGVDATNATQRTH